MILIKPRSIYGSASIRYTGCINNWVKTFCDHIDNFIRPNYMNAYSHCKGVATSYSSGNTPLPPLSSIFHNGKCTLGVVLDLYWKFSESGDHCLGSILDGLDPCSEDFGVLPHNSTVPYDDPLMQQSFNFCFGKN